MPIHQPSLCQRRQLLSSIIISHLDGCHTVQLRLGKPTRPQSEWRNSKCFTHKYEKTHLSNRIAEALKGFVHMGYSAGPWGHAGHWDLTTKIRSRDSSKTILMPGFQYVIESVNKAQRRNTALTQTCPKRLKLPFLFCCLSMSGHIPCME